MNYGSVVKLILEANLDEDSVDSTAQNAEDKSGIDKVEFDKIVKNLVSKRIADLEVQHLYDAQLGKHTIDTHFIPTAPAIEAIKQ